MTGLLGGFDAPTGGLGHLLGRHGHAGFGERPVVLLQVDAGVDPVAIGLQFRLAQDLGSGRPRLLAVGVEAAIEVRCTFWAPRPSMLAGLTMRASPENSLLMLTQPPRRDISE
jgi:hypothetical protein